VRAGRKDAEPKDSNTKEGRRLRAMSAMASLIYKKREKQPNEGEEKRPQKSEQP